MTPDWARVKEVFGRVMDTPPERRAELLAELCAGDAALEAEVRGMLGAVHTNDAFLQPPTGVEIVRAASGERVPRAPTPLGRTPSAGDLLAARYRLGVHLGGPREAPLYRALDQVTVRPVVVRRLARRVYEGTLAAEIACIRRIQPAGVARVLDDGFDGDDAYVVTELVEGRRLGASQSGSGTSSLASGAVAACKALARLHRLGAAHGDVRPVNVLVRDAGDPVLVGLARPADERGVEADTAALESMLHTLFGGALPARVGAALRKLRDTPFADGAGSSRDDLRGLVLSGRLGRAALSASTTARRLLEAGSGGPAIDMATEALCLAEKLPDPDTDVESSLLETLAAAAVAADTREAYELAFHHALRTRATGDRVSAAEALARAGVLYANGFAARAAEALDTVSAPALRQAAADLRGRLVG